MKVTVKPGFGKGKAAAPPSKSMAQRYLICAALCEGTAGIENIAFSDDVNAALRCVKALGAEVRTEKNTAFVTGKINPEDGAVLDCSSSESRDRRDFQPLRSVMCSPGEKNVHFSPVQRGKLSRSQPPFSFKKRQSGNLDTYHH